MRYMVYFERIELTRTAMRTVVEAATKQEARRLVAKNLISHAEILYEAKEEKNTPISLEVCAL